MKQTIMPLPAGGLTLAALLARVWPVGAVYMSLDATSPAARFGGTWTRIEGRFLLAADSSHAVSSTGGEETHALTLNEMPKHAHMLRGVNDGAGMNPVFTMYTIYIKPDTEDNWTLSVPPSMGEAGGDVAHNNMPPYVAVYVWRRTS